MNVSIVDFGADPQGANLCTGHIQKAIDTCAEAGGGTVTVPAGLYRTGTFRLRSHITLHLSQGATLKGSDQISDYPPIDFAWYNNKATIALIHAFSETSVRIVGEGTIDLNAQPFMRWDHPCSGLDAKDEPRLNAKQWAQCHVAPGARPTRPIFLHDCDQVEVEGVTLKNSPCWTLTFSKCRRVRARNLTIDNSLRVPHSDGVHCCSCQDVVISGCFITSGDDCVAITGISDWEGVSERILISDCTLRSSSAALRIGHEASKVRGVVARGLVIADSNRGVAVFAGEGGYVEDVLLSDLIISSRIVAGPWWGKGEPLVVCAAGGGRIKGVSVRNVAARAENGVVVAGDVQDVSLRDWSLTLRHGDNRPLYGGELDLSPAPRLPAPDAAKHIPWLHAAGAGRVAAEGIAAARAADEAIPFDITPIIQ